jgi:hypothetical protein
VADLVECACQISIKNPHPLGFPAQGGLLKTQFEEI